MPLSPRDPRSPIPSHPVSQTHSLNHILNVSNLFPLSSFNTLHSFRCMSLPYLPRIHAPRYPCNLPSPSRTSESPSLPSSPAAFAKEHLPQLPSRLAARSNPSPPRLPPPPHSPLRSPSLLAAFAKEHLAHLPSRLAARSNPPPPPLPFPPILPSWSLLAAFAKDHLPHLPSRLAARSPSPRLLSFPRPVAAQVRTRARYHTHTDPLPFTASHFRDQLRLRSGDDPSSPFWDQSQMPQTLSNPTCTRSFYPTLSPAPTLSPLPLSIFPFHFTMLQGGNAGEGGPLSSPISPLAGSMDLTNGSSSSSSKRLSTVAQATQQQKSSGSAAAVEDSKIDFGDFFKGDLPKKFLMLLGLLALSRVGIYIPLWGVDISAFQEQLGEGSFLATLDTLSGGGIGRLGLFSLGIVPYINAQIVFQLLGTLYPKIADLQKKEGEAGRKKAQQYMKYMAVAFGALQAIGQVAYLQQYAYDPSATWAVSAVSGLTLGSVAVILLGDKITDLKLGNGTSLLIFTNIVSYLPASIGRTITEASEQGNVTGEALLLASFLLLVFGIVYVQEAERRIPINYASRYNIKTRNAYLPFKVNSTGVMPIIFSSSLLAAPYSIARFTGSAAFQSAATALYPGGLLYLPANVALIAFFNYFYTFLQLDPADVSDQLKRQGASVPNTRPGKATAALITK
ncbi:unnamed protein product, partial [Closterium sp. Naga37s-1]